MISVDVFSAYLHCPTKCWLISAGEKPAVNIYAEWLSERMDAYRTIQTEKLISRARQNGILVHPCISDLDELSKFADELPLGAALLGTEITFITEKLVAPTKPFSKSIDGSTQATKAVISAQDTLQVESENVMHVQVFLARNLVAECSRPKTQRAKAQYRPVRFQYVERVSTHDRMLLGFDATVLSMGTHRPIEFGKIIYGIAGAEMKVDVGAIRNKVNKAIRAIDSLLDQSIPPELVLNAHCSECGFQQRCRKLAEQAEDLSLLANMSAKERERLNERGIFTITQLSHTFRPRRFRRAVGKSEKYQHAVKALAIREQRIHIVGSPKLEIKGAKVYLDVEGLPDTGFYYLIGLRVVDGEEVSTHSLWADTPSAERHIWGKFCEILGKLSQPTVIHYGSYEVVFLKRMQERYGVVAECFPTISVTLENTVNVVSLLYAKVYFPTYSNGLKEIGNSIGFTWSDPAITGLTSIVFRHQWEAAKCSSIRQKLIAYNADDCTALHFLVTHLEILLSNSNDEAIAVETNRLANGRGIFKQNQFILPEMEQINRAAYWDYQREKIYVKSKVVKPAITRKKIRHSWINPQANRHIHVPAPLFCIRCNQERLYGHQTRTKTVIDIRFGVSGIKRWVTEYHSYYYRCPSCGAVFRNPEGAGIGDRYGHGLRAFCVYQNIDLRLSQGRIAGFLKLVLSIDLKRAQVNRFKAEAANEYGETYQSLRNSIANGRLVHADETQVNIGGMIGYVWVFTNLDEVIYLYSPSRDGDLARDVLKNFTGVLVTDFYAAYEGIACPQQKCLVHLIRDLNEDLYKEPFNAEYKNLVAEFTKLLTPVIRTIDRFGLKTRFLKKHKKDVVCFFRYLASCEYQKTTTIKCKQRLERHRNNLFTFLDHDDVPWNNNNAEHAVKAFALLRKEFEGLSTEKGIKEYLILLSICETCRFKGLSFLDFLLSGEKDVNAFAKLTKR